MFCIVVDHCEEVQTSFVNRRFLIYMIPALLYLSSFACGVFVNETLLVQVWRSYICDVFVDSTAQVTTCPQIFASRGLLETLQTLYWEEVIR